MSSAEEVKNMIYLQITADDPEVTSAFMARYERQATRFAELMALAMIDWNFLITDYEPDESRWIVVNLMYCAITLHIQSMKLFLSGHTVAAGNLSRQVIEAVAMSLLGSGRIPDTLEPFKACSVIAKSLGSMMKGWQRLLRRRTFITSTAT
jgi:hypothetical protein